MKHRNITQHLTTVDGVEIELSSSPSWIMQHHRDALIERRGPHLVVGYLVDDTSPSNPLEDQDGLGNIYTRHRHSKTLRDMQEAMAMDSDFMSDLSLVDEFAEKELLRNLREQFQTDFVEFLLDASAADINRDVAIRMLVEDYSAGTYRDLTEPILDRLTDWKSWDDLRQEQWNLAVKTGAIGNSYTVVLDCYSHGQEVWSLSGQGMQCRFDTVNAAGVWVPDDCLKSMLEEVRESDGLEAARAQARVYAEQCLSLYNDWLSGNCYGWQVDSFVVYANGVAELDDENACYGYYGDEHVYESLKDAVKGKLESIKRAERQAEFDFGMGAAA